MINMHKSIGVRRYTLTTKVALCIIAAFMSSFVIANANTLTDIVNNFLTMVITYIATAIVGLFDGIANYFISAMRDVTPEVFSSVFGLGFETFTSVITDLGIGLAILFCMWQMLEILFAPALENRQVSHPVNVALRIIVFMPITFFIQKVSLIGMGQMQIIWNAFNAVGDSVTGGAAVNTSAHFSEIANTLSFSAVDSGLDGELIMQPDLLGVIGTAAMIILIMWNFMKLLLEACQRFISMYVYCYLSPLAAACGVSTVTGRIFTGWVSLYLSSGVLWILNTWCISITITLIGSMASATTSGVGLFAWAIVTYGFVKVAQQLDDVFNQVGANVVRQTGGLMEDLMGIGHAAQMVQAFGSAAVGAVRGYRDIKAGIRNGVSFGQGNSPTAPAGKNAAAASKLPNEQSKNAQKGTQPRTTRAAEQSAAGPTATKPATPSEKLSSSLKEAATKSLAGSIVYGAINSGKNFSSMMAERSEAIAQRGESERLFKAMKNGDKKTVDDILAKNPGILQNNAYTQDTAAKALGLKPENGDTLNSLRMSKDGKTMEANYTRHEVDGTTVTATRTLSAIEGKSNKFTMSADNRSVFDPAKPGSTATASQETKHHDVRALGNGAAVAHGYTKADETGKQSQWGGTVQETGVASDAAHAGQKVMRAQYSNGSEATIYANKDVTAEAVAESLVGGQALSGKQMQMGDTKAANSVSFNQAPVTKDSGAPDGAVSAMRFEQSITGAPDAAGFAQSASVSGTVYDMGTKDGKHTFMTQYDNGSKRIDEASPDMSLSDYASAVTGGRTVSAKGQDIPVSRNTVEEGSVLQTASGTIKTVGTEGRKPEFVKHNDDSFTYTASASVPEPGRAYSEPDSTHITARQQSGTRFMSGGNGNAAIHFDGSASFSDVKHAIEMPEFYRDMQSGGDVSVKTVASTYGADMHQLEKELTSGRLSVDMERDITNMSATEQKMVVEAIGRSGGDMTALARDAQYNRDNIAYLDAEQKLAQTKEGAEASKSFAKSAGVEDRKIDDWVQMEESIKPKKKRTRRKRRPQGAADNEDVNSDAD